LNRAQPLGGAALQRCDQRASYQGTASAVVFSANKRRTCGPVSVFFLGVSELWVPLNKNEGGVTGEEFLTVR